MKTLRSIVAAVLLLVGCVTPAVARQSADSSQPQPQPQSQSQKTEQQNAFIPIEQLPPQEQLPAARLLIAAYVFVLAALFLYVVSVSRRVGAVRREVQRLEADLKRTGRA